ncbi:MAG: hypothetical protein FWC20_09685 [Oscillospiraceae bacterium]|nr:hypothetical protein [Oscillospiraceae bacterium]MCL2279659.1 hypothetical protein [Oscillospiraceae bacterium]
MSEIKIRGIVTQTHELSYDKIIKNTLAQSDEMTIRFINGLLGENISLDAKVEWLDKESVSDKYTAIVADFYPRVDGRMYTIEVEQDGHGDMAVRVFRYAVGGAMLHGMSSSKAELSITFPQPCVVFLSSTKNTPREIVWNIDFFDGQKVTLKVPTLHLSDLTIKEVAARNLLPIGQFYLRMFDKLTQEQVDHFRDATAELLGEMKNAVDNGTIPRHVGVQMQENVRKIVDNIIAKSDKEVGAVMTTTIVDTLPWVDYKEVFDKLEERGKAEGMLEGKREGVLEGKREGVLEGMEKRDFEISCKAFEKVGRGKSLATVKKELSDFGISNEIITKAYESVKDKLPKVRSEDAR